MELLENNSFSENLSSNDNTSDYNLDSKNLSLHPTFLNSSDINATGNKTEDDQVLYQVHTVVIVMLSLLYGAICITAILGNLLVLGLVITSKKMQTVTNLFIANLALADIIIATITIPFQFQAALLQRWDLPNFLCALCPFVQVLTVTVSILTLVVISLDRFRAVIHPFKAQSSKKKAFGTILTIWVISILLALPTELDYSVVKVLKNGETKDFCTNVYLPEKFRIYYNQGLVIIQYFFPLIVISGAYLRIGRKLWRSSTPGNQEKTRDAIVMRNKKKAVKMIFTVVFMFALCWLPLQIYNFLTVIFPSINSFEYINILWFGFHLMAMSNSCCNPFIYAFFNKKFKTDLFNRIPCLARFWPDNFSRSITGAREMNYHTNVMSRKDPSRNGKIHVIFHPIQSNVLSRNNIDTISAVGRNILNN